MTPDNASQNPDSIVRIDLKRRYRGRNGLPIIERVDIRIFLLKYPGECLTFQTCHDSCCSFGADVDPENLQRLAMHRQLVEPHIGCQLSECFTSQWTDDPEYPGRRFTRTKVTDGRCIFLNRHQRGCLLHSICLANRLDYHLLKPMVCSLFPVTWDDHVLLPSNEILDGSLQCSGTGNPLFHAVIQELRFYFGDELIAELQDISNSLEELSP